MCNYINHSFIIFFRWLEWLARNFVLSVCVMDIDPVRNYRFNYRIFPDYGIYTVIMGKCGKTLHQEWPHSPALMLPKSILIETTAYSIGFNLNFLLNIDMVALH